jgi:HPt (histidine-containing phosphotransfer) domain-containing protein
LNADDAGKRPKSARDKHRNRDDTGPAEEPIDFDDLVERCLGNLDFVDRVLTRFQAQFDGDFRRLQDACQASDPTEIARVAHLLKGFATSVPARTLQQVAGRIENLGRTAQLDDIPGHLDILENEWTRFVDHATLLAAPAHE